MYLEPKLVTMHQQLYPILYLHYYQIYFIIHKYHTGEEVEAKCQKTGAPECNAWFEATVINFNPETNLYTIKFKGY